MSGKALNPSSVPFLVHRLPVPRPSSDPDTSPEVSVCFNEEWLPHVLACLKALTDPAAWQATTQAELDEAMKRSMLLTDLFSQAGPCVSPPAAGCFIADFTLLDYDFVADVSAPCLATWSSTGWDSCSPGITSPDEIKVDRLFSPAATFITAFSVTWNVDAPAISSAVTVTFLLNGSVVGTFTQTNVGPGTQTYTATANVQADEIIIDLVRSGGTFGTMQLKSLELCYVGAFPLSTALPTWEHTFDFSVSDGGFVAIGSPDFAGTFGTYVSGTGWVETCNHNTGDGLDYMGVWLKKTGFTAHLLGGSFTYDTVMGSVVVPLNDFFQIWTGATLLDNHTTPSATGVARVHSADNGDYNGVDKVQIGGLCSQNAGCDGGSVTIKALTLRGIGSNPF